MVSICSCLILGLMSSSGELEGIGDVDALLLGVTPASASKKKKIFILEPLKIKLFIIFVCRGVFKPFIFVRTTTNKNR